MGLMDYSRQLDLHKLNYKLQDPKLPEAERKKIETAIYGIKHQAQFKSVQKLRDKLTVAIKNGDNAAAEALKKQAMRMDRDYKA
jgi:hypothetical protein